MDPTRCTPALASEMQRALEWFGLDWDGVSLQSANRAAHAAALDRLIARGDVYACRCSRASLRAAGLEAADGGWRYPGTCRERPFDPDDLEGASLRLRLEPGVVETQDESGLDLCQDPASAMGDPVLRRRDGAIAYHLAVVVDDAEQGIGRIVRGRDLAVCTAIHRVLQQRLGLPTPRYRHHLLLLEERGDKLSKLHGAVSWQTLRERLTPEALCGVLAHAAGLRPDGAPVRPSELRDEFAWDRVFEQDRVARWTGETLEIRDASASV